MKKLLLLLLLIFTIPKTYSQSFNYYNLYNTCDSSLSNCWKLVLCWEEESGDWASVGQSDMIFCRFPKTTDSDTINYRLVRIENNESDYHTWQYKDSNITIRVRMKLVETAFGYNLYDISYKNKVSKKSFYIIK